MKTTITLLLLAATTQVHAQFLGGFFSQQSDKQKLMATQIAEYQVYLSALKTGYTISKTGLNTAEELKNGSFTLNAAYFNSLAQVNPVVTNNPKGKSIVTMAQKIGTLFSTEISWQSQQKQLSSKEQAYLQAVCSNMLNTCQQDVNELSDVLTPGKLKLTDQERLERLDKLYATMQDKLAFTGSFIHQCHNLALARAQHKNNNQQLKSLYGIQ